MFTQDRPTPAERIYRLKREVLELYGAMAPLVDPLDRLERGDYQFIPEELRPYFRDVSDHLIRSVREVDGFRELLTSVLTANLTQISVRQNEDVRKISAWAGDHRRADADQGHLRDELRAHARASWRVGYPLVLALMARPACCSSGRSSAPVGSSARRLDWSSAPVAQGIERAPPEREVAGSIPARRIKNVSAQWDSAWLSAGQTCQRCRNVRWCHRVPTSNLA